jgi:hypothetical protein
VFDNRLSPNEVSYYSTFLFWTIVYTGSRKYRRDPTIFDRLSKPIIDLATSSLCFNPRPVATIQAILILCHWPVPLMILLRDPFHALAGAALGLALQNGLHLIGKESDFASKQSRPNVTLGSETVRVSVSEGQRDTVAVPDEISFRTRLWIHSVIAFQRYV